MKELILTETIKFNTTLDGNRVHTFPNIQEYLNNGYTVKEIFQIPSTGGYFDIAITVHLYKSE